MNRELQVLITLCLFILWTGCISKEQKVMEELEHPDPINCDTAEEHIKTLESEKTRIGKQILVGATAVTPAGAVIGILTLSEVDKLEIAVGEYNRKVDERIAAIKEKCGLE